MPGSEKILKNRERAANRAAGIGDKDGKLTTTKKPEVMIRCTLCQTEIRATKRNVEAGAHASSRHPQSTFQVCFPGAALPENCIPAGGDGEKESASKPKVDIDRVRAEAAEARRIAEGGAPKGEKGKKKKKKDDLSELMAAMNTGKK